MTDNRILVHPVKDIDDAAWIIDSLRGGRGKVASIIPSGFEAYTRLYHPAWRVSRDNTNTRTTPMRWSEVAEATGRVAHRQMQWAGIAGNGKSLSGYIRLGSDASPIEPPDEGTLPLKIAEPLASLLARYTKTPEMCQFAVWDGFNCSGTSLEEAASIAVAALDRRWYLFRGPLSALEHSFCESFHQSANMVWPEDRAWCVATDVDLMTTYVGGKRDLIEAILTTPALEADEARTEDSVFHDSDPINPV